MRARRTRPFCLPHQHHFPPLLIPAVMTASSSTISSPCACHSPVSPLLQAHHGSRTHTRGSYIHVVHTPSLDSEAVAGRPWLITLFSFMRALFHTCPNTSLLRIHPVSQHSSPRHCDGVALHPAVHPAVHHVVRRRSRSHCEPVRERDGALLLLPAAASGRGLPKKVSVEYIVHLLSADADGDPLSSPL